MISIISVTYKLGFCDDLIIITAQLLANITNVMILLLWLVGIYRLNLIEAVNKWFEYITIDFDWGYR